MAGSAEYKKEWASRPENRERKNRRRRELYAVDAEYREKRKEQGKNNYMKDLMAKDPNFKAYKQYLYSIKTNYGLSQEDFEDMIVDQLGRCDACEELLDDLHVDHCHENGDVRGILCPPCNMALGQVKESTERLQKLIMYLERQ